MYCIICGKKIKNGSQYCRFCGSPQEDYDPDDEDYTAYEDYASDGRERYEEPVEHHFPFGILFVAILTVSIFIALVLFPNKLSLGLKSLKIPKTVEKVVDQFKEKTGLGDATDSAPAQDDDADSIVGVYKAVSAVYEGETLDGFMLKLANISFKVNEDGTFDARIKNEPYSGSWYQEGEYVEFVTDQFYFTGSFSEDILSMSDDSVGIAVVLEKK